VVIEVRAVCRTRPRDPNRLGVVSGIHVWVSISVVPHRTASRLCSTSPRKPVLSNTSIMASPAGNPPGKHPVSVDDDADIDELDGADSNNCTTRHRVIHRMHTLDRCTRGLYAEPPREVSTSTNNYR
jgi:hypothetical protein